MSWVRDALRPERRWSLRAVWKWARSFSKREWDFVDYPVRVRPTPPEFSNSDQPQSRWQASIENARFYACGATPDEARADLARRFADYAQTYGSPPRPGLRWPLRFAATALIDQHYLTAHEIVRRLFDIDIDEGFVSDESSLWDFHSAASCDAYVARIQTIYGVDVSDVESMNLAKICERVDRHKAGS